MNRIRKLLVALGLAAVVAGGLFATVPTLLWGEFTDHSHVVSIKGASAYQDPALLAEAWSLPVARLYGRQIEFQRNGSFCGPASVANVLRSMNRSADQVTTLRDTDTFTLLGFLPGGVTLDQLADIARKNVGPSVDVLRDLTLPQFRDELRQANDPARRYIVNFTRGPLFGGGGGHHSPIAGYLVADDLVLVLDVNRDFGPWLVKTERLLEAMNTVDPVAKKKRGLLVIRATRG